MAFNKCIILVLSLSSLYSLYAETAAPGPQSLEKICRVTPQPKMCVDSIAPLLPPGVPVDTETALQLGLKNFGDNVNSSLPEFQKLKKEGTSQNDLNKCIDDLEFIATKRMKGIMGAVSALNFAALGEYYDLIFQELSNCNEGLVNQHDTELEKTLNSLIVTNENNRAITDSIMKSTP